MGTLLVLKNALIMGKFLSDVTVSNGKIVSFSAASGRLPAECIDLGGKILIPGLIDVHTHGIGGIDTMDADFVSLCKLYAKEGTTSVLPTTMTMPLAELSNVCEKSCAKLPSGCANILGIHLEGPYISPAKKGAQNELFIRKPSFEEFSAFKNVKMITVAPEISGCMDFIEAVASSNSKSTCVVSIGHTDCDCDTALEAISRGANCLTHTFNTMPPMLHRAPGPIGAAVEKHIYAQIICDGIHVAKSAVLAAYKMFGADRMVLISDSLQCACLPDGEYKSGGLTVILKGGCARLKDGVIAGSAVSLLSCVKKAVEFGIPFEDAVNMASRTPAEMLQVPKGKIEEGYDADCLVLKDDLTLDTVIIGGEVIK